MKRIYTLLSLMWVAMMSWATDVTFTFNTEAGLTALGIELPAAGNGTNIADLTLQNGPVTMTAADGNTPTRIWNSQGNYALRVYTNGSITFSVKAGAIKNIVVTAANTSNFQFAATTGQIEAQAEGCTWTGNAGSVTLAHTDAKNSQVATVTVTVDESATPDEPGDTPGEEPVDPSLQQLASLEDLYDLPDGTTFQCSAEVYVNYQNGQYLYIQQLSDEGDAFGALIYGNVGREYNMGAVIPAGWKGTKTTYKGLVEITQASGLGNATSIVDEYDYSAFDVTGQISTVIQPESGWENYKVVMEGVQLSTIDEKGNFTITNKENGQEVSLAGYNRFGAEYPETVQGETFTVEGMVSIYNDAYQLYPISISVDEGERLWKVWYFGEDEDQVKVVDSLYVVAATQGEDGNLVYVTDNATKIFYDLNAEWGYTEWIDWSPDYVALDCGTDAALFQALSQMKVIAPGTVRGTLMDNGTNPRIVLSAAPQELAGAEAPELNLLSYDLAGETYTNGNQVSYVSGTYTVIDGQPYLYNPATTVSGQKFLLDFAYADHTQAEMQEGVQYNMFVVWKQHEEWEDDTEPTNAPAKGVKGLQQRIKGHSQRAMKAAKSVARRMPTNAADYYTNYTICPISIEMPSGVNSLNATTATTGIYTVGGLRTNRMHKGVNIIVSGGKAHKVVF